MNKIAQEIFFQKGICLVNQVKSKTLKKIAKTIKAKPILNIEDLDKI